MLLSTVLTIMGFLILWDTLLVLFTHIYVVIASTVKISYCNQIDELNAKARLEEKSSAKQPNIGLNLSGSRELLCEHKGSDTPHFAIGLCETCYNEVRFSLSCL